MIYILGKSEADDMKLLQKYPLKQRKKMNMIFFYGYVVTDEIFR